jgi:hypothetical protein
MMRHTCINNSNTDTNGNKREPPNGTAWAFLLEQTLGTQITASRASVPKKELSG